ncbi:hypothetical protein ACT29H_08810 [Thermophagus sp. OGC60D27]
MSLSIKLQMVRMSLNHTNNTDRMDPEFRLVSLVKAFSFTIDF